MNSVFASTKQYLSGEVFFSPVSCKGDYFVEVQCYQEIGSVYCLSLMEITFYGELRLITLILTSED